MKRDDLTGRQFSRWTVLGFSHRNPGGELHWLCRCDCGSEQPVKAGSLRSGASRSCGCLFREVHTIHGKSGSREFKSWDSMRQRCTNPNDPSFARYGGRGITVCDRWLGSFEAFFEDMGPRPPGTTLDRIDNDKGYDPDNCRWSSLREQQRNKDCSVLLTVGSETLHHRDWAARAGLPEYLVLQRIRAGWPAERIVTEPKAKRRRRPQI